MAPLFSVLLEESLCVFHVMQTYDEPKGEHADING